MFEEWPMKEERMNCIRCKNYYVTWDARFPRGCKLFAFKGSVLPSVLVQQATGKPCSNFEVKKSENRAL